MKKKYEQPRLEVTEFRFSEQIASSPGTKCYPIWSNTDTTGDNICDNTPVYVGKTN